MATARDLSLGERAPLETVHRDVEPLLCRSLPWGSPAGFVTATSLRWVLPTGLIMSARAAALRGGPART